MNDIPTTVLERTALTIALIRLGGSLTFTRQELADHVEVGARFEPAQTVDGFTVTAMPTGAVDRAVLIARDLQRLSGSAPHAVAGAAHRAYGDALARLSPVELRQVADRLTRGGE